jgi:methanogenic corrinoid protein MtbC1
VIELFQDQGIRERFKIFVGGAVITQSFADRIGADFYAKDAMECVKKAKHWIKGRERSL